MESFYDQILPKLANKIGKKFGSKIESTKIEGIEYDVIREGDQYVVSVRFKNEYLLSDRGENPRFIEDIDNADHFDNANAANNVIDNYLKEYKEFEVNSLPITDKMYETAIGEGFPLFKKPTDFETLPEYKKGRVKENLESTKRLAADIGKKLGVEIDVVEYANELPQGVKKSLSKTKLTKAYGVYDPVTDKVYLVAYNLEGNAKLATETALHEVVGHKGFWNLLGTGGNAVLDQIWDGMSKENQKSYLDTHKTKRLAAEEFFAENAEENKENNWYGNIIAKIREILRKMFPRLRFNRNDILDLLKRSKQKLKEDSKVREISKVSEAKFKAEEEPTRMDKKEADLKAKNAILKREMLSYTNHAVLKKKIKDMKVGYRLGKLDMKEQVKAVQNDIIKYAKRFMPLGEAGKRDVGKLLTLVKTLPILQNLMEFLTRLMQ